MLDREVAGYSKRRALTAIIVDQDDCALTLNIASNNGASASIFDWAYDKALWPDVHDIDETKLSSVTLPTLIQRENIEFSKYHALLTDTQGTEFLILKGTKPLLHQFRIIQAEVEDFEPHSHAAIKYEMIVDYINPFGFKFNHEMAITKTFAIGGSFNLSFERNSTCHHHFAF